MEEQRQRELLNQLWNSITLLEDKQEVISFLKGLLTPSESIMLAKRIELVKLHDSGISLSDIRRLLHITKVTSYKWQERLNTYRREFKVIIDRLREMESQELQRQARQRDLPQGRRKYSILVSTLGTAAIVGHKKLKKIIKRRSSKN